MFDTAAALGVFCVQLGLDLAVQVTLAILMAYAWEYERRLIWWDVEVHPVATDLFLLGAGVAVGAVGVLLWPDGFIDRSAFLRTSAIVSPAIAGVTMHHAGRLLRGRGHEPPFLLAVHAATIFVVGVTLIRTALLSNAI